MNPLDSTTDLSADPAAAASEFSLHVAPAESPVPSLPPARSTSPIDKSGTTPGGKRHLAPAGDRQNSRRGSSSVTIKGRTVDGTLADIDTQHLDDAPLMLRKSPPNVFPLLLTPIDGFYCADDSSRFPMTSIIYMDFEGEIDRESFELALDDALVRHPLLGAHIRLAKRGLPCWVPAKEAEPQVDWGTSNDPVELLGEEGFDLEHEVGIRFWIRSASQATRVTIQVHHACTDGTGVYRFLGDLWALYGIRTADGAKTPQLGEMDPQLLRFRRRRMSDLANREDKRLRFVFHGIKEAFRVFGKRVQSLAAPDNTIAKDVPRIKFPGIETFTMSKDEHESLRAFAAKQGAMLNDLLMAEMFRTIIRWNDLHGSHSNRWFRIMMPSDLRDTEDYAMPASNMTSYTFLARRRHECTDATKLIRGIREQTGKIKHKRLGTRFVDAITLAAYRPKYFSALLNRDWCIATTALSNVGDPSKRFTARFPRKQGRVVCGNLILDHVSGVPPLRNQTHATLAIFTYRRQLTISVRCNPYLFDKQATLAFLDMYESGLRSYLDA